MICTDLARGVQADLRSEPPSTMRIVNRSRIADGPPRGQDHPSVAPELLVCHRLHARAARLRIYRKAAIDKLHEIRGTSRAIAIGRQGKGLHTQRAAGEIPANGHR